MTYFFALMLLVVGGILLIPVPSSRIAPMLVIGGIIVLVLRITGAIAADKPVPLPAPRATTFSDRYPTIWTEKQKAKQQKFERFLLSPIGKGRLE
jgi:hypothetical protein